MSLLEDYPVQVEELDITTRLARIGDDPDNPDAIPVALTHNMEKLQVLTEVMKEKDRRAAAPRRRQGNAILDDLQSFVNYTNMFKQPESVVYADPQQVSLTTYFNYHPPGGDPAKAGWCDFYAHYGCPIAPEWKLWTEYCSNGDRDNWMQSTMFADLLDMRMDDLTTGEGMPQPVEVLEMARNLQIHTKGTFAKKVDPTTGGYAMVCKEEHAEGSTKIHRAFQLALRVFEGGHQYGVEARIRFRIRSGVPEFSFLLHRLDEVRQDAFKDVYKKVGEMTKLPVFIGRRGVR